MRGLKHKTLTFDISHMSNNHGLATKADIEECFGAREINKLFFQDLWNYSIIFPMQISSKFHRKTSDKNRQNKYAKEMCSIYLSSSFLLFLPSFPSKLLVDATEHLQVHSRNIISDQLSLPPVTLTCRLTTGFGECVLVVSGSDDGGRLLSSEWIVLHQ